MSFHTLPVLSPIPLEGELLSGCVVAGTIEDKPYKCKCTVTGPRLALLPSNSMKHFTCPVLNDHHEQQTTGKQCSQSRADYSKILLYLHASDR